MIYEAIILNLPKDLGDCLLATPAIKRLKEHAIAQGAMLVVTGPSRSREWVETLSGLTLEFQEGDALLHLAPRFVMNFNFYDADAIRTAFPAAPLYAPERLRVLDKDESDFGVGAVLGKKHISLLLEDALKDAGVLGPGEMLSPPELPAKATDRAAISNARLKFALSGEYALLIPVAAANRPLKKWPKEKYAETAKYLLSRGITPVLIGGPSSDEKSLCAEIMAMADSRVVDLCGQTSLAEIAALAKGAKLTLGNDTGPTHIAAATGVPTFIFFGYYNDPATWKPMTPKNTALVLGGKPVPDISVSEVLQALKTVTDQPVNPKSQIAPGPACPSPR